eukprot:s1424_g9.t1
MATTPVPADDDEEADEVFSTRGSPAARQSPASRGGTRSQPAPGPTASYEQEQYRMFQAFLRQQEASRGSDDRRQRLPLTNGSDDEGRGGASGPPPEWAGPSTSSFEDWAIRARLWIATTKTKPTARGPMLLKSLSGAPFESFKYLARDQAWLSSSTNAEELINKMDSPEQYGDDKEEHLLESLSRITFHLKRNKSESWREYFARWESALRKVKEHRVELPETYLGFLLVNGLRLDDNDIKAMLNFTRGDIKPTSIKAWLRKNEAKLTVGSLGADKDSKKGASSTSVFYTDQADDEDIVDYEDPELETFYAELNESVAGEDDIDGISEGEAAEILHTLIKKNRTFTQSIKAKKAVELGRGYGRSFNDNRNFGKGNSKGSGKHYHLTVEGIRSLVRCYNCDQKGHIAKHCPNPKRDKSKGSGDKEVNLIEGDSGNSEAFFCGMIETMRTSTTSERPETESILSQSASAIFAADQFSTSRSDEQINLNSDGVRNASSDYMRFHVGSDLFFFENLVCNSTPKKHREESACATLDTGCQRSVIGLKTLEGFSKHLPSNLRIHTREVDNRFKSVHGVSETSKVALMPCSLGPKGCYLNPAIFENGFGVSAPLLLSLPFMLQSKSQLILDPERGLGLQMENPKWFVQCHIGPSGALRIPLTQYTRRMLYHLERFQHDDNVKEFEILNVGFAPASVQQSCAAPDDSSPGTQPDCHGGIQQQASAGGRSLRSQDSLAPDADEATLGDSATDPNAGEPDQDGGGRRGESYFVSDEFGMVTCGDDTSSSRTADSSRTSNTSRNLSSGPDLRTTRTTCSAGNISKVQLSRDNQGLDLIHPRQEQQSDLLPLPSSDRTTMQLLRVERAAAVGRSTIVEVQGGRAGHATQQHPDPGGNDPGHLQAPGHHEGRDQRPCQDREVQSLREDPDSHQEGEASAITAGRRVPTIHSVPGVPEGPQGNIGGKHQFPHLSDKKLRQIKFALKQSIDFWRQIQRVFESAGLDEDTIACHLSKLNSELMHDLIQHPRGTKKTKQIAEAMNLSHQQLRTVAEIYNPACFGRLATKHGLFPGLAFDLSLGVDLLKPENQERVRNYLRHTKPGLVLIAPPCELYSQLQNLGKNARARDPARMLKFLRRKREANKLLNFAIEIALLCHELHITFVLEHPWGATSWATHAMEQLLKRDDIYLSRCDQCMFGLRSSSGQLQRKRTGFATNNRTMAEALEVHCNREHDHMHIIGGSHSKGSQVYPQPLLNHILKTYKKQIPNKPLQFRYSVDILDQDRHADQWFMEVTDEIHVDTEPPTTSSFADLSPNDGENLALSEEQGQVEHLPDCPGHESSLSPCDHQLSHEVHANEPKRRRIQPHQQPQDQQGDDSGQDQRDDQDPQEGPILDDDLQPGQQAGDPADGRELPARRAVRLQGLIKRAHEGLGHPHLERFLRILRYSNANKEVMDAARKFRCSACERNSRVRAAKRAAPPREINVNEVVGIDVVWIPTHDGKTKPALNCIDWNTHFQLVVPMENKTPESCREAYRQWLRFFGPPTTIALDLGREFEGSFIVRAETDGSFVDPSSVESPYQRGITERNGKTFKLMLSKALEQYDCKDFADWRELVDTVNYQKNRLLMRNGYSPIQRVIGFTPKLPGGIMSGDASNRAFPDKVRLGDEGVAKSMAMRKAASIAFHQTECDEALRRALASGPRPIHNFEVGELVYFWRVGQGHTRRPAPAYWHGPSRVVMTDPPTTLWLSYQGTLVKASPERVRRASEDEQTTLTGWIDDIVQTRQKLDTEPKRGFLDLSEEPLPPPEGEEPGEEDQDQETDYEPSIAEDLQPAPKRERVEGPLPVVSQRLNMKTNVGFPKFEFPEGLQHPHSGHQEGPGRVLPPEQPGEDLHREPREHSDLPELQDREMDGPGGGMEESHKREAEEEAEEHDAKRLRTEYLEVYMTKVAALVQSRQRKEVKINEMGKYNKLCFKKATEKEVKNNIQIGAYSPVSIEESARVRQQNPERIMSSRYVYTAKPLEPIDVALAEADGLLLEWSTTEPHKAKVRHVMQGYSEHGSEYLNSTTPQVTRDGAMFTTQIIASMRWRLGFLDFTQAFHSGDQIDRLIYAEQPHEGIPGLVSGQLLKLHKTCYGLTDGPYAWYSHITRVIKELGYEASRADPCLFYLFTKKNGVRKLSGIISMATDDLLHGGDEEHMNRMNQLKEKYKMGKFQFDQGRFCGKNYSTQSDGSILVTQENFVNEKITTIPISPERRRQRYSKCTPDEISALRALLGSLSWLAKETRPDIAGRVALLQQSLPVPRIRDLVEANLIAAEVCKHAHSGIRIMPIEIENLRVGVISDASWGNSQGQKTLEKDSPDRWEETDTQWIRHHVAPRTTTFHSAASETGPDLHDLLPVRTTVANGHTIQDDWTSTRGISTLNKDSWTGKTADDKRTAIDIAILKDDLSRSGGHPRWIEGSNMIADPLTKKMRGDFLRGVANQGFWTLSYAGHQKLKSEYDILLVRV